jgi:uncharacterized protein (DUF433 family)
MSPGAIQIEDQKVPLSLDDRGLYRVRGTRVTLDCVVEMWLDGAAPEEIAEHYDVLQLDDVYAVITYYLRHQAEVDQYIAHQKAESEAAQEAVQGRFPTALREKLLTARRKRMSGDR